MRLIDADKLINSLRGNILIDVTPWLEEAIEEQPTAYDVEAVVKRLEEARFILTFEDSNPMDEGWNNAIDRAIEIVQKGGKNE